MIRVFIYGFYDSRIAEAMRSLENDGTWKIARWYGAGEDACEFDENIIQWHLGHWGAYGDVEQPPEAIASMVDELSEYREMFNDQISRNPCMIDKSQQAYDDLFGELVTKFLGQLKKHQPQLVVFQNLPHEGFEFVLYLVARKLGIGTLLLYQSLFPNRFFHCESLEDFGYFETSQISSMPDVFKLPRTFEKDLFYMEGTKAGSQLSLKQKVLARTREIRRDLKTATQWFKRQSGMDRLRGKKSRPVNLQEQYQINLRRAIRKRVKLTRPFVYFPLHLQPELTTSAIGGIYTDQLLAIEHLRRRLPGDWRILVKENPKQTHKQRGSDFFERLRKVKNAILVDRSFDTYELTRRSEFVATVTGTVGWEAISGGKPALVFGNPWYLKLPGVFQFDLFSSIDEIVNCRIDHDELQQSLNELLRKTGAGIVDLAYVAMYERFDKRNNQNTLQAFLRDYTNKFSQRLQVGQVQS